MLSLNKRTEYALIALSYLAEHTDRTVCARELVDAHGLPSALLMNILKDLQQHGLVASVRGTKGGYRLDVNPADITLYDLILTLEGPVRLVECVPLADDGGDSGAETCRVSQRCSVQGPLTALHHRLVQFLREVRLCDLLLPGRRIDVPLKALGSRC